MMTTEKAIERIGEMRARWPMYAATREGFTMALWVLLEVAEAPIDDVRDAYVRLLGNAFTTCREPLTQEFVERFVDEVMALIPSRRA